MQDPLNGRLRSDSPSLATVADDFGHIIQRNPLAVLQPGSPQDIAKIIRYANHIGVTISMRGQGHSPYGQAQVNAGIVMIRDTLILFIILVLRKLLSMQG